MPTTYKSALGPSLVTEMSLQDFPTNSRPSRPHGGRFQKRVLICGFFTRRGLMRGSSVDASTVESERRLLRSPNVTATVWVLKSRISSRSIATTARRRSRSNSSSKCCTRRRSSPRPMSGGSCKNWGSRWRFPRRTCSSGQSRSNGRHRNHRPAFSGEGRGISSGIRGDWRNEHVFSGPKNQILLPQAPVVQIKTPERMVRPSVRQPPVTGRGRNPRRCPNHRVESPSASYFPWHPNPGIKDGRTPSDRL